jgi:4-amino-4-deoxy-L-arabinose transferase-like glycosyltransferase
MRRPKPFDRARGSAEDLIGERPRRLGEGVARELARLGSAERIGLALLALAMLAGAILRLHAIGGDDRLSSDELGYIGDANKLIGLSGYNSFHWAPGTPILFTIAAWLSGNSAISAVTHSHGIAQYAQWLVEMATLALAGALAWRLAGIWAALLAVFAIATYGPLIVVTRTYLSEPLGGLMLVAMVGAAALARTRGPRWLAGAGVIAGLACLAREDFLPGLLVVISAFALERGGGRRRALRRAAIYGAAALVTLAPWVAFASAENHGLVAVTTGGTDSLFIGTYLPGDGSQFQTVAAFKHRVCQRFPKQCDSPPGDAGPMFRLIQAEHPGDSRNQAIIAAVLSNLDHYMLGRPLAFVGLLARKLWGTWSAPWSGGNGTHEGPSSTATALDLIAAGAAWLGVVLAAWLYRRRWEVVVATAVLVVVVWFNDWFGPEPRDTLRLAPLLFALGASGLVGAARRATGAPAART